MSRLEEIIKLNEDSREVAEYAGITLTLEQYDYLIQQAERVEELEDEDNGKVNLLNTIHKLKNRVEELEKLCKQLIGEEWMNDEGLYDSEMMKLEKENQRYKQALEEIAQDTGTPYADIAIKALAGDNS